MESEIYQCTDCGIDVNKDAEICPQCGVSFKKPKNDKGSKIIGLIITFFALIIASSASALFKSCNISDNTEYSIIALYIGQLIGFLIPGITISLISGLILKLIVEKIGDFQFGYLKAFLISLLIFLIGIIMGGNLANSLMLSGILRSMFIALIFLMISLPVYKLFLKANGKKLNNKNIFTVSIIQAVSAIIFLSIFISLITS